MTPGLAKLTEEVATAALPGLADDLWRLVYTRGHVDVERARPSLEGDYAGILVYAHALDAGRALLVVETVDRLVGAVASIAAVPRCGSAVRLTPTPTSHKAAWRLIVDEAMPKILDVRFDRPPLTAEDRAWVGTLREALASIRATEAVRREGIAARRRRVPPFAEQPAPDAVVRERLDALRREVQDQTDYTPDELADLDAARFARRSGSYGAQRRAFAREAEIMRARQQRYDARMRDAVDAFRSSLPEVHAALRARYVANENVRAELQRLEDAAIESRARTEATFMASRCLEALAEAPITATAAVDLAALDDVACANEVLRALALLARSLPRVAGRIAV